MSQIWQQVDEGRSPTGEAGCPVAVAVTNLPPAVDPSVSSIRPALHQVDPAAPASPADAPLVLIANPSPDVYGSDLQMLETVTALRDAGYRVKVALPSDGPLVPRLSDRGAEVIHADFPVLRRANQAPLAFLQMLLSMAVAIPRLVRLIRSTRAAAVYVNTVTLPWWLLAARLARVPVTCHVHEVEDTDGQLVLRALYSQLLLANIIIVNSVSALEVMAAGFPRLGKNARLVYNGVPQPPAEPEPARRSRPFRVLSVGRLGPRKAQSLALDAVGLLRGRGYDVEIELAGSAFPGYEWYVEQLHMRAAQPDLSGAVTFAGYCSPIWPNLQQADAVVQPAIREAFGNAVIEAQMAGRPVIANAAFGHLETITDGATGLLSSSGDVEAMADAIARIIDDDQLACAIAESARGSAIERFSLTRYAAEICAVIDALVPVAKRRFSR